MRSCYNDFFLIKKAYIFNFINDHNMITQFVDRKKYYVLFNIQELKPHLLYSYFIYDNLYSYLSIV